MKNRKLSARAVVSLMLSAILFCMPIGAFFANRANTDGGSCGGYCRAENRKCGRVKAVQKAQRPVLITRTVPVVEENHTEQIHGE